MPKSKSRQKKPNKRYNLEPQRKQPSKKPARWYAPAVLIFILMGVAVVVLNYMQILPGTRPPGGSKPIYQWSGLAIIALGMIGTMRIR
jgi:Uncharacterised protein family (UPF0233).